ncbi:hypothetical protein CYLTODRAFT_350366 [Cylindrobasidium torrendii FP15055 ss-10]|uniref:EF-hand domain-containing protein n=1 Tax=Cylindrobasidium torrendii FP15055 ss-10 TaxID=1314674 RepID=A0A0D7BHC8_9AGAR|nr:hypothetical protein CYLTODRAFT_350366 [Cylindrobasidium torrendii FP15055 ss-10]
MPADPPTPSPLGRKSTDSSDTDTTATNSSDQFDWNDGEADHADEFEASKAKRLRVVYLAFMKLSKTVRTLLVGILGAGALIAPLLVVQLRFKDSVVRPHVFAWSLWATIIWATGCATYVLIDWLPRLIVGIIFLVGAPVEHFKFQLELMMAVSGWLKLALDVSWAWIALSVIRGVYNPPGKYWVTVNRVISAIFAASIIILVEKLFLQFVAINFHEKALAERLEENRLGLRALDRLSNAQPKRKRNPRSNTGSVDLSHQNTAPASVDHTHAPSSPLVGGLGNAARAEQETAELAKQIAAAKKAARRRRGKSVGATIGDFVGQLTLKNSRFNRTMGQNMGGLESARRLARKLFGSLGSSRDVLLLEDFYPYFRTPEEARDAFALFDKDGNGDISKREMREAVQRIYRERKSLVTSMKDAGSAVSKLDYVCLGLCLVGIIFVCMLIFNKSNTLASLVPLATIILGFSFIFGNSAATLFNSLLFIFSTHVFDIGDLVLIDDQALMVKEFGLFATTFRRVDGQEIIAPNALMSTAKLIHNLRRSKSTWETTNIQIAYNTPLDVFEEIRSRIKTYVTENNRDWSGMDFNIDKMDYQNAIHIIVAMEHRSNWQEWGKRWERRTRFMRNLKQILEDLSVKYTLPVQPVILQQQGMVSEFTDRFFTSRENLGNAGRVPRDPMTRPPGRVFRTGIDGDGGGGF